MGTGEYYFPRSADHEQDWQPYPVDPYSAVCDDHTYTLYLYSSSLRTEYLALPVREREREREGECVFINLHIVCVFIKLHMPHIPAMPFKLFYATDSGPPKGG